MTKQTVRTRFAPSPTGYMHIGNLRTALYGYLYAKSQHGQFILRIEDTDRTRYVADAVDFINRTLEMAHIVPDESPALGGPYAPYVQSERLDLYKKYAEELVKTGHAYYCFCDPEEDHSAGKFGGYDRTCRNLSPEVIEEHLKNGDPYVIRQKMPLTGETTFFDVLHGNITIKNEELEDQVLLKRDGMRRTTSPMSSMTISCTSRTSCAVPSSSRRRRSTSCFTSPLAGTSDVHPPRSGHGQKR